jgi:PAS domain S-box-containing protein
VIHPGLLVVPDGREDPRFADHPLVVEHGLVFYAGAPVLSADGHRIGTLCVLDDEPYYDFSDEDRLTLEELAAMVTDELEFRITEKRLREEMLEREEVIEELEKREYELSEQKSFTDAVLHNIPGAWAVIGEHGQIERVNGSAERVTGYSEDEIEAMELLDFVIPEHRDKARSAVEEAFRNGTATAELCVLMKSGEIVPYMFYGQRTELDGDYRVVAIGIDISELKEVQEELQERERMYRQLTDNIQDVFWISDVAKSWIVYTSPAYEDVWGLPVHDLYANPTSYLEAIHPEDRPRVIASLPEQAHGDWSEEYRVVRPDGTIRWIQDTASPIENDQGVVYRIACIARDITPEVEVQRKLKEARDEAQEANRAKSEFLSRMSHELRTPLNTILGYAQILLMDDLEKDLREPITDMERAGRHLLDLINEVLEISRIEAGRMKLSLEPVDVAAVLEEVIAYAHPMASKASVTVHPVQANCDVHVMADNQRLKQVLLNLVSNAVKYNVVGGHVTISCRSDNGSVRIEVGDTGRGLTDEQQDKLFRPFERLGLTEGDAEGTGLGLALSKNLVEVMGGTIGVESAPGDGSSFWVSFPKADSPLEQGMQSSDAAEEVRAAEETFCILYIEDNLSNLKLLDYVVSRLSGVELQTALQGSLGIELAVIMTPDLILVDLNLPDMDGADVIVELRRRPETAEIPVVVLSADATRERIAQVSELGIHAYLTKPLDVRAFLDMVEELRE